MDIFNNNVLRPFLAAIFLSALVFTGCKKNDDGLGSGILPEDVLLGIDQIDTLSVLASTVLDDSVRADHLPAVLLGAMNDPVFGETRAGFYTQVRLSSNAVDFSSGGTLTNLQVDSVVLALVYANDYYGDNFQQEYEVYELEEQLYPDSVYFSYRTIATKVEDLITPESKVQTPDPESDVFLEGDTIGIDPQLRLGLDPAFGQTILDAGGTPELSNNDQFTTFMKGLYVTVSDQNIPSESGGIHYFNLLDPESKVTIYYSGTVVGDTTTEHHSFDLVINSNAPYFTRPVHNYDQAHPDLVAQIAGDVISGQQIVFVQAAAGLKTEVSFPFLDALSAEDIAINKAELIIPFQANSTYSPTGRLFALGKNSDGTAFILPDMLEGDSHFGGFMNPIQQEYRINISRWVQQVLQGSRINSPIEIISELANTTANRVVLNGPEHPDNQMRLILYYTKY